MSDLLERMQWLYELWSFKPPKHETEKRFMEAMRNYYQTEATRELKDTI